MDPWGGEGDGCVWVGVFACVRVGWGVGGEGCLRVCVCVGGLGSVGGGGDRASVLLPTT